MNAYNTLLALILVLMALNSCEPMLMVKVAPQALVAAAIYLHRRPEIPACLKLV